MFSPLGVIVIILPAQEKCSGVDRSELIVTLVSRTPIMPASSCLLNINKT